MEVEESLENGDSKREGSHHTLKDAFERYSDEVSVAKKGERWEKIRLNLLCRYDLAHVSFLRLSAADLSLWRDKRLKEVSAASVNRELNLISSVIEKARKEWGWAVNNPIRDISRPRKPRPRDRRISDDEIARVLDSLGYSEDGEVRTAQQGIAVAFLLALEAAMRLGEIADLRWDDLHLHQRYLTIRDSKNSDKRDVPLTKRAVELLRKMEPQHGAGPFQFSSGTASTLFRRAVQNAEIRNMRFHDSRHEALTRLARKIDVLDLARMVGHRDPRSLMIYYNATASEIAGRLD